MTSKYERWLGHFDLYLHVKNRVNDELNLRETLILLDKHKLAKTADVVETEQRWIVQLADIKIEDTCAVLLFLGIDKDRAESIYGNTKTLDLRPSIKQDDEGVAVSAHLVVSAAKDKKTGRYNCVLEEVEGLSRSRVIPYLRRLINKYVQHSAVLANGNDVNVDSNLVANLVLDKPIGEQLADAKLVAVELVRKPSERSIDKSGEYYEKSRLIQFRPTHSSRGARAKRIIASILDTNDAQAYPEVRIRVDEDDGRERTVSVERFKHDALTAAFQLRTLVADIKPPLPEASEKIISRLAKKMVEALS